MVEALGIDLKEIIFAIVNFLILVGVLAKFLYHPFLEMLENRKQTIKDSFAQAAETIRLADEKLDNYNMQISNVERESREIIKNAKLKAEAQASDIIDEANAKAAEIKLSAEKEAERQQAKALAEVKAQVAAMALLAAEKILEKELELEGQEHLIDNIIEQVGAAKWQN
ncbi:F0F1 ATP synthase subunit B [Aminipila sp.]|jgi:F-type H+-transporting ATPase subunit b|uniref:F0F1 ATP synthase subunit B n=1 Tax=Aminipila sp. TaxID=2060095 RepID=UPI001D588CF0|nr:F0F1 ATP synthase subunit B [Aminipila sp.]MBE6033527.1 F0F1 ATP synthase subunit B [Clostridiales bacterium]